MFPFFMSNLYLGSNFANKPAYDYEIELSAESENVNNSIKMDHEES